LIQRPLFRLGDRHSENILLDVNTGDIIHVDFDCLFERVSCGLRGLHPRLKSLLQGKRLETPERVPFRLTQNMQDGLGITNVDGMDVSRQAGAHSFEFPATGPFRIACEITMGLLRRNKDCLMSVLDAFIHDPLVEWEDEKKRMVSFPALAEIEALALVV
jgi:serine/threonine-protein kinase ATR